VVGEVPRLRAEGVEAVTPLGQLIVGVIVAALSIWAWRLLRQDEDEGG
jgi:hypothetical protein